MLTSLLFGCSLTLHFLAVAAYRPSGRRTSVQLRGGCGNHVEGVRQLNAPTQVRV
jgi:hypothetical protein